MASMSELYRNLAPFSSASRFSLARSFETAWAIVVVLDLHGKFFEIKADMEDSSLTKQDLSLGMSVTESSMSFRASSLALMACLCRFVTLTLQLRKSSSASRLNVASFALTSIMLVLTELLWLAWGRRCIINLVATAVLSMLHRKFFFYFIAQRKYAIH